MSERSQTRSPGEAEVGRRPRTDGESECAALRRRPRRSPFVPPPPPPPPPSVAESKFNDESDEMATLGRISYSVRGGSNTFPASMLLLGLLLVEIVTPPCPNKALMRGIRELYVLRRKFFLRNPYFEDE